MIIAYKKGKWFIHFGKFMYPKDYSNITLGFDLEAKLIQIDKGVMYYRFRKNATKIIDPVRTMYGKLTPVWEPVGEATKYRFKEHLFELQQLNRYDHRPRRKPAYKRIEETWWSVLSVDGQPTVSPVFSYQRAADALEAMDGYIRMTKMVVLQAGHDDLAKTAKVVYLF